MFVFIITLGQGEAVRSTEVILDEVLSFHVDLVQNLMLFKQLKSGLHFFANRLQTVNERE